MMGKVCVFLTNCYENDARVKRECSALKEAGYKVRLIYVQNYKNRLKEYEIIDEIEIVRIDQFSKILELIYKLWRWIRGVALNIKNNRLMLIVLLPLSIIVLPMYIVVKILNIRKFFRFIKKLSIIFRMIIEGMKDDYDIYHCNDLDTLLQGFICSKVLRNRVLVYDSHEVQTSRTGYKGKKKYAILEKVIINKVDKMMMTTETRAEFTEKIYGIRPEVIHNYPLYMEKQKEKNNLRKIANIDKDEPILLYQGGIQIGRGLEKIIEAIPKFNKGIIVFIGDGAIKEELEKMVLDYGVSDRVRFIPKVDVEELMYYTQHAYLGFQVLQNVCFNHYSTLSNKLFEYMMMEVPVVASDFPEISRVVREEKTGLCINPHDSNNIADAVNLLLENRRLYEEMKGNCKSAKLKYNWNWEKHKFISIYDNLMRKFENKENGLRRA